MAKTTYNLAGKVWIYPSAHAAWHFVSVPKKESAQIKKDFATKTRGWGSLPVEVTVGQSTWKTSIFPDKRTETYILPLKADIRRAEDIFQGETIQFRIVL